jgi:hypothetical protein
MLNDHIPTEYLRQRVSDLARAGTPKYLIAKVIEIDDETLTKYYSRELELAKTLAIEQIANTVYVQAINGDTKAQALYLKTQGASHGWVEKQVIEVGANEDTKELQERVLQLEKKYEKDY